MLRLTDHHVKAIEAHGQSTYPHECCGIILGKMSGGTMAGGTMGTANDPGRDVTRLLPVENERGDGERHNRYTIPPKAYMQAERTAMKEGLDVLGFYHSHPDVAAQPSQYDIDHAWPVYAYVIVSIRQGVAAEMTCWQLREDRTTMDPMDMAVQPT